MIPFDPTLVTALAIVAGSLSACAAFMVWCCCRVAAIADALAARLASPVTLTDVEE